ncbi:MAG: gluconeogenesis factor YvcK family protein [Candidatus Woesearchaeota archaeon]
MSKRITLIGGGTGSFTLLTGLKLYPDLELGAIVAMSDDGGSTGILRDEYGILPPGDIRQCLVALSESESIWRDLFAYRFNEGSLEGQSFGNMFIGTLEKITGDFEKALSLAGELLKIKGTVIPVTLDNVRLEGIGVNGNLVVGEKTIDTKKEKITNIRLVPEAYANPRAIKRILESDAIIIAPGDLYTSILPNLAVNGICDAIRNTGAIKILVVNLMCHKNHTDHLSVAGYVSLMEKYLGKETFDYVLYNNVLPTSEFMSYYSMGGELPVSWEEDTFLEWKKTMFIGHSLISQRIPKRVEGDRIIRGLIRHDPMRTAALLYSLMVKK